MGITIVVIGPMSIVLMSTGTGERVRASQRDSVPRASIVPCNSLGWVDGISCDREQCHLSRVP